jgi:hypothetical protein
VALHRSSLQSSGMTTTPFLLLPGLLGLRRSISRLLQRVVRYRASTASSGGGWSEVLPNQSEIASHNVTCCRPKSSPRVPQSLAHAPRVILSFQSVEKGIPVLEIYLED